MRLVAADFTKRRARMTNKPTHASVTARPCTCGYPQRAADDAENPVVFDERTSEYQFTYQEPGLEGLSTLILYHCPFCGGAVPGSKRSLLFATIPGAEAARLVTVLEPVKTVRDALEQLGPPDFDGFSTTLRPERDDQPPLVERHRDLRYYSLSDVADIWITERSDGAVHWQLQGKYVGE
jgi:hypothetical protein